MALRGLSTLSTLRIFTTEIALDLHKRHNPAVRFIQFLFLHSGRSDNSLHPHRKQGDPNHNQIQDVEGVPAEGALVHECSINCHLSGRNMKCDKIINLN